MNIADMSLSSARAALVQLHRDFRQMNNGHGFTRSERAQWERDYDAVHARIATLTAGVDDGLDESGVFLRDWAEGRI
jgi:hypothetical protein